MIRNQYLGIYFALALCYQHVYVSSVICLSTFGWYKIGLSNIAGTAVCGSLSEVRLDMARYCHHLFSDSFYCTSSSRVQAYGR